MKLLFPIFVSLALVTIYSGCLDTEVKDLNPKSTNQLLLDPAASTNLTGFKILYASKYKQAAVYSHALIQGNTDSGSAFSNICGTNGINCYCDFFDGNDNLLASSGGNTTKIQYSSNGNFVTCAIPSSPDASGASSVRIRNASGTSTTAKSVLLTNVGVSNSGVSLSQVIGGLDNKYVRSVYSYQCYVIGREGTGASSTGFACTANPFNLLLATYHYYVYQDGFTSITGQRATGAIYNNNQFCGIMANAIDCTSINSTLTRSLGLLSQKAGAFQNAVTLYTAPPLSVPGYTAGTYTIQGYAIPATEFLGSVCPVGLVKRDTYTITVYSSTEGSFATRLGATTDLPDLNDVLVDSVSQTETMSVKTYASDGACAANVCTMPSGVLSAVAAAAGKTMPNTSTGSGTPYCAIDSTLLP